LDKRWHVTEIDQHRNVIEIIDTKVTCAHIGNK
jgi:hypothetical protein